MKSGKADTLTVDRDLWIGIGFIILGIVLVMQISAAEEIHRIYPKFVFGFIIFLGITTIISSVKSKTSVHVKNTFITYLEILYFIILFLSLILIQTVGFYISSVISVTILFMVANKPFSRKKLITAVLFSVSLMIIVYILFTYLLGMSLPSGVLGN